jgi:IS5 family transposase
VQLSKDPDARWLKKGKKNYFGYKAFIATDTSNGFIHNVAVLPANASEIKNLKAALGDLKPKRLYADKGYSCNENRNFLRSTGIKNGIMYKAARNTTLTRWQKLFNRIVSSKRYIIEQGFGTLKRIFGMNRAKYTTS